MKTATAARTVTTAAHIQRLAAELAAVAALVFLYSSSASAMLPSLCSVFSHWTFVSGLSKLDDDTEGVVVHRVMVDVNGDGRFEILIGHIDADSQGSTNQGHVYTPVETDNAYAYVGAVSFEEAHPAEDGNGMIVLYRDSPAGGIVREQFEVTRQSLTATGEPAAADEAAMEAARAWRASNDVVIWQSDLKTIRDFVQAEGKLIWKDRDSDRTQADDVATFNTPVPHDRSGRKSTATRSCLLK